MATGADIRDRINGTFNETWNARDGRVIPANDDVVLKNGAVRLEATFLYADLAHSTQLVLQFSNSMAAKIVRAYLSSMTRLVNANGGKVRSFDGDRVMGVFVGSGKNTQAAKCALQMHHVVANVLRPAAEAKFPSLVEKGFQIRHCAGADVGRVLVVRGGVREQNDLVFVGPAPNIAAKLSELREAPYYSFITAATYGRLNDSSKYRMSDKKNMWAKITRTLAGREWTLYRSHWSWSV